VGVWQHFTNAHAHTHARTHWRINASTHGCSNARLHARSHARSRARTNTRTHARMHTCTHNRSGTLTLSHKTPLTYRDYWYVEINGMCAVVVRYARKVTYLSSIVCVHVSLSVLYRIFVCVHIGYMPAYQYACGLRASIYDIDILSDSRYEFTDTFNRVCNTCSGSRIKAFSFFLAGNVRFFRFCIAYVYRHVFQV